MAVNKPYYRTVRQLVDGSYAHSGNGGYIQDVRYANEPSRFTRAFLLIQKDLIELFNFIEPADQNLKTYSYKTHELLLRACIEIEANCKNILLENTYTKKSPKDFNIKDYHLIEKSHHLSEYKVQMPHWEGKVSTFQPFRDWGEPADPANPHVLSWYSAYNQTKHNRSDQFHQASFEIMLNAVTGLAALLWAQFRDEDFLSSQSYFITAESKDCAVGGYFSIIPPTNWPLNERYDFQWGKLSKDSDPFQKIDYDKI